MLAVILVHKERQLDFVGWYTLLPLSGPTPTILPIHSQVLEGFNESALLLGFHPEEVLHHSLGGKLPLTAYESNYEVDDHKTSGDRDGEDRKMDDGDAKLKLKFREVPYSVETDETEMISMNYVAASGGTAASAATKDERPARSIESTGKGKRRLVEAGGPEESKDQPATEEIAVDLSREEEEMVAALTAKANAIKMLHSRIRLLTTYLERLPPSYINGQKQDPIAATTTTDSESMDTDYTTPSLPILRQVQALVSRLDLVIPSDKEAFDREMLQETNDVNLIGMLNSLMQSVSHARDVGRKAHVVELAKNTSRRGGVGMGDYMPSPGFNMPGAGDILI